MAQVLGSLLSMWETKLQFLVPGYGLAQLQLLAGILGANWQMEDVSLCSSTFQIKVIEGTYIMFMNSE